MIAIITISITLAMLAVAVYTDVRWGKILNAVTVPGMVLGLILNTLDAGVVAGLVKTSLLGIGVGLGLFFLSAFLGRILGGGDIKLLIAVGALQGPGFLLQTIVATALIGGVLAVAIALCNRILTTKLKSLVAGCYLRIAHKTPMRLEDSTGPRLPYAIAIGLGAVVVMAVLNLR